MPRAKESKCTSEMREDPLSTVFRRTVEFHEIRLSVWNLVKIEVLKQSVKRLSGESEKERATSRHFHIVAW